MIRVGNTMPYSGPLSAYGTIGHTLAAYFQKINDEGGINGRKIDFRGYDDAFNPAKTFEQTRKLIDSDEVLFVFGSTGSASNSAVMPYMNRVRVRSFCIVRRNQVLESERRAVDDELDPELSHRSRDLRQAYFGYAAGRQDRDQISEG